MAKLAILGFGNIGGGTFEVLNTNKTAISNRAGVPVDVKYILDIRDFSDTEFSKLAVNNIDVILQDKEVSIVVETMGGIEPAYYYVKSALRAGKSVVTSNKELVATHGTELIATAKQQNVCFLFEASVCGGMPLITPIHQCLIANNISQFFGIVNGTTNFMLTMMALEQLDFDSCLKKAQELGYAETKDPSADIDGIDAQRKISIIASLLYGSYLPPSLINAKGIRDVTKNHIAMAEFFGGALKLIAYAGISEDGDVYAGVEPMIVRKENMLAGVCDVYNGALLKADMLGDVFFYGKGAGRLPTASAVVSDVVDCIKNGTTIHDTLFWGEASLQNDFIFKGKASYCLVIEGFTKGLLKQRYGAAATLIEQRGKDSIVYMKNIDFATLCEAEKIISDNGGVLTQKLRVLN